MLTFAKIRRFRSVAVFVLLGWIFALAIGSAYGCTFADAEHSEGRTIVLLNGDDGDHHPSDHAGSDHDSCVAACELQASPVVKEAAGHSPDMQFVALYTAFYFPAFYPSESSEHPGADNLSPHPLPQSLRSTRLTL